MQRKLKLGRLFRVIFFIPLLYFSSAFISTTEMPALEAFLIRSGIPPFWDADLMMMRNWNREVRKNGIQAARDKFLR